MRALISTSGGHPVSTVRRNGTTVHLGPITPVKQGGRYIVGFLPDVIATTRSVPVWKAPGEGLSQMWTMISGSVTGIRSEGTSSLSGPVGIVRVSASAADTGAPYYLWLLAYISLSLGILNLLPFLPLDGGHILLVVIEKLRGRALSRATFERVSMAASRWCCSCSCSGCTTTCWAPSRARTVGPEATCQYPLWMVDSTSYAALDLTGTAWTPRSSSARTSPACPADAPVNQTAPSCVHHPRIP